MRFNGFGRAYVGGVAVTACVLLSLATVVPGKAAEIGALCSGIGEEAVAEAAAFKHTLKLVYAQPNGQYLGNVMTEVSKDGTPVVTKTCPGPWLLLDLPRGDYKIRSQFDGQARSSTVQVTGSAKQAVVTFPAQR